MFCHRRDAISIGESCAKQLFLPICQLSLKNHEKTPYICTIVGRPHFCNLSGLHQGSMSKTVKGRYAPSPTGRMHLGNAMTALLSWLCAKSRGGQWLLRIEDLDTQRCKRQWAQLLQEDLLRLGLEWDEGGLTPGCNDTPDCNSTPGCNSISYCQSERSEFYAEALKRLEGLTYPCYCTRADIMAAGAPHESDGRVIYNGRCRQLQQWERPKDKQHSIRIAVPDKDIIFNDLVYGRQRINLQRDCGDFILRRSDGGFAYQLAVVVDDALMGITQVVRGRDLLLSTAQQIFLYESLGFDIPEFCHLPLICNTSGQRLSKRDKSLDMGQLLKTHSPEEIIGHLAFLAGITNAPEPCLPKDLIKEFSVSKIRQADICTNVSSPQLCNCTNAGDQNLY